MSAAEAYVVQACMYDRLAIPVARALVDPADFTTLSMRQAFEAILHLHDAGADTSYGSVIEWVDADKREPVREVYRKSTGATRVVHYARIVAETATLERLGIELGKVIDQARAGDISAVEAARTVVDGLVVPRGTPEPSLDVKQFMAITEPYDWVVPGLIERGDRLLITGAEGHGKAVKWDTPVPTPRGWTIMGELKVGDKVFGADGKPTRVIAATPPLLGRPCYRIVFSDGAVIVADAEHQWVTETQQARDKAAKAARRDPVTKLRGTDQRWKRRHYPSVVTTAEIRLTLRSRAYGHSWNHSVAACGPLRYDRKKLPIDPYTLGAWLGDGTSRGSQITCGDEEIIEQIRSSGQVARKLPSAKYLWSLSAGINEGHLGARSATFAGRLRSLGIWGDKRIPRLYLESAPDQRLALLQGLMDTDGTVFNGGEATGRGFGSSQCEITLCKADLMGDVRELISGLGIKSSVASSSPAKIYGRTVSTRYRLSFVTNLPVFRLPRKVDRMFPLRTRRGVLRYIEAVEPVDSVPVRCIEVDNPDGMFVVGRECIPTHNSTLLRQMAVSVAAGMHPFEYHPFLMSTGGVPRVSIFDMENSPSTVRRKLAALLEIEGVQRNLDPARLRIECRPGGVDLTTRRDRAWLTERVMANRPDLMVIGPVYKLYDGDPNDERLARAVTTVLDDLRTRFGSALLIEAHSPHGGEGGRKRDLRPFGSSLWRRWPEFGYGLHPTEDAKVMQFKAWRGDRDVRDWPKRLVRSEPWPWGTGRTVGRPVPPDSRQEAFENEQF